MTPPTTDATALPPELGDENVTVLEDKAWGALPESEIRIAAFVGTTDDGIKESRNVTPETALPTFDRDIAVILNEPSMICETSN